MIVFLTLLLTLLIGTGIATGDDTVASVKKKIDFNSDVRPILHRREANLDEMLTMAAELLLARNIVQEDEEVVFVVGVPPGVARSTNVVKLHRIGEEVRLA